MGNNHYSPTKNLKLKMKNLEIQEQEYKEPANKKGKSDNQYILKTQHDKDTRKDYNFPEMSKESPNKDPSTQIKDENMEEKEQELNPISVENQSDDDTKIIHSNQVKTETKEEIAKIKIESE